MLEREQAHWNGLNIYSHHTRVWFFVFGHVLVVPDFEVTFDDFNRRSLDTKTECAWQPGTSREPETATWVEEVISGKVKSTTNIPEKSSEYSFQPPNVKCVCLWQRIMTEYQASKVTNKMDETFTLYLNEGKMKSDRSKEKCLNCVLTTP